MLAFTLDGRIVSALTEGELLDLAAAPSRR
jgi:hypothetical protein